MKYNKIYVLAPNKYATGGVELSHQLVDYLRNHEEDAYIVYINNGKDISTNCSVTEVYKKYNVKVSTTIEDDEANILILPEMYFEFVLNYHKIKIGCWWMSVDNRYKRTTLKEALKFNKPLICKLKLLKNYMLNRDSFRKNDNDLLRKESSRIIHFYQSVYAQQHLYNKKFSKVLPLSDYINTDFLPDSNSERENVVLYNPVKGGAFVRKIANSMQNVRFVELKGFTRSELVNIMNKAKLYVDFGHFPGKDRLPRETVLNGCVILTGKAGASFFYEDVAIPDFFKIDAHKSNISEICNRINYILNNYQECYNQMLYYKGRILKERERFYNEINDIFIQ